MLSEAEVLERAKYCYCVFLQLSWLHSNDAIPPAQYPEWLAGSSLALGTDRFITMTLEEAMMENRPDGGLLSLIALYEGFAHAFCEVLETDLDAVGKQISPERLKELAGEMGLEIHF